MGVSYCCDGCGKSYRVDDALAGKRAKCRECGHVSKIPGATAAAAPRPLDIYGLNEAEPVAREPEETLAPVRRAASRPKGSPKRKNEGQNTMLGLSGTALLVFPGAAVLLFLAAIVSVSLATPAMIALTALGTVMMVATGARSPRDFLPDDLLTWVLLGFCTPFAGIFLLARWTRMSQYGPIALLGLPMVIVGALGLFVLHPPPGVNLPPPFASAKNRTFAAQRPSTNDPLDQALYELKSPDRIARAVALNKIWQMTPVDARRLEVAKILLPKLADDDSLIRISVIDPLIAWCPADQLVPFMISALNCQEAAVRTKATELLVKSKDPRCVGPFISRLGADRSERDAENALKKIGPMVEEDVLKVIAHRNPLVRESACWILGDVGTAHARPALEAATRDSDPVVASVAQQALDQVATRAERPSTSP